MEPWMSALLGGVLIGTSASLLLWLDGRIAGVSGIVNGLMPPARDDTAWRLAFLVGLMGAGAVTVSVLGQHAGSPDPCPEWVRTSSTATAAVSPAGSVNWPYDSRPRGCR